MRNTVLATLALASQLFAGGFYLQLGNPEASPEARKVNAVLTMRALGCGEPWKAQVTGTAVGVVNGKRQEIALKVLPLSEPGMFAITQQWPKEGRWVIELHAKESINGAPAYTHALPAGPQGVDRLAAKSNMKEFGPADTDAMLK